MTREEAIIVLDSGDWWEELSEWYSVANHESVILPEAISMAISALREQDKVVDSDQFNWISVEEEKPEEFVSVRSMRSEGYKCYNTECGCCIGGKRCGEPFDIALGCDSRMVRRKTNADHIRSMTDEELVDFMGKHCIEDICSIVCGGECKAFANNGKTSNQACLEILADWLKQPYKEET